MKIIPQIRGFIFKNSAYRIILLFAKASSEKLYNLENIYFEYKNGNKVLLNVWQVFAIPKFYVVR